MQALKPEQKAAISNYLKEAYKSGIAANNNLSRTGASQTVRKSFAYNYFENLNYNGVAYPRDKIPDQLLRLCEKKNLIIGAICTLRQQQAMQYCKISHEASEPGLCIKPKDENKKPNSQQKKQIEFLENLIVRGHTSDYRVSPLTGKPESLKERLTKFVRDKILIDKNVFEIERNLKGQAVALWTMDGASIFPVLPGGYYGSKIEICYGIGTGWNRQLDLLKMAKQAMLPDPENIAYVQDFILTLTGGGVVTAFSEDDVIYNITNLLNDVRYYKQGLSNTEKANEAIIAFINSFAYNANGLAKGAIPKVAIAMGKEATYNTDQLQDLQIEFAMNFEGTEGQWEIPLLNGDAKVLNLMQNNRDMEYNEYLQLSASLICASHGCDSAELGLRLSQAQNVMNENVDGKQKFSRNRALADIIVEFANVHNEFLEKCGYDFAKDFVMVVNGLLPEDKMIDADIKKKQVETNVTLNESRRKDGLPDLEFGDVVLHPSYIQWASMQSQKADQDAMMGGDDDMGDGGDTAQDAPQDDSESEGDDSGDMDSMIDEAMDEIGSESMQKAKSIYRVI